MIASPTRAAPTPIPAFAPVESPDEEVSVLIAGGGVVVLELVGALVVVANVEDVVWVWAVATAFCPTLYPFMGTPHAAVAEL
jgi:hypothetical protein